MDYGLLWSHQDESTIKQVDDNTIVFDNNIYSKVSSSSDLDKKTVNAVIDGNDVKLTRQKHSYHYQSETGQDYLLFGDGVFLKSHHIDESHYKSYLSKSIDDINQHMLIKGDNLHSLKLIEEKFKGSIDCITIDPPYNTGNEDMKYNDCFPVLDNGDRHSSWLSFMSKRLLVAKELLSNEGLIFINIDEFEYPYLRLLCDQIFGFHNLVESFVWEKNSTKNNSRTTSTNHENILCYAKDKKYIEFKGYFRVSKEGIHDIYEIKDSVVADSTIPASDKRSVIEDRIKGFLSTRKDLKGIKHYKRVDQDLNIYRISDVSAPGGGGLDIDIIHPLTGKPCKAPSGGYRYNREKVATLIKDNRFHFGTDERTVPQYKRFLHEVETEVVKSVIKNTDEGKKDLEKLDGVAPFNNPKPVSLIKQLISMMNKNSMICLDFFAGSGTTGQAVLELNKDNGTNHSFILMTNNENNIYNDITKPRIESVANGTHVEYIDTLFYS